MQRVLQSTRPTTSHSPSGRTASPIERTIVRAGAAAQGDLGEEGTSGMKTRVRRRAVGEEGTSGMKTRVRRMAVGEEGTSEMKTRVRRVAVSEGRNDGMEVSSLRIATGEGKKGPGMRQDSSRA